MNINVDELINILKNKLEDCDTEQKIIEEKNIFIKNYLNPLYQVLKTSDNKKEMGLMINEFKNKLNHVSDYFLNKIKNTNDNFIQEIDPLVDIDYKEPGRKHIINYTIELIASFFKNYNFQFVKGNEIISTFFNFDMLNMGKNHVARDMHDSLFIDEETLLRTHCTSSTAKSLLEQSESDDIRVFSYGNVYRKDDDDATHSHQFTQIDIVWLKKGFSLSNLKFIFNQLIKFLFGNHLKVRYRLSYFPFTEPSFEVDVQCMNCLGDGCSICKKTGWIEILGAGMLNQEVIKKSKIKNIDSGLAAGIGVERIAMLKFGIKDIRHLYTNDFDINKQFKN